MQFVDLHLQIVEGVCPLSGWMTPYSYRVPSSSLLCIMHCKGDVSLISPLTSNASIGSSAASGWRDRECYKYEEVMLCKYGWKVMSPI